MIVPEINSGIITGVTVSEGNTKVVVETEDGQKHSVDIGNISKIYDLTETAEENANDPYEVLENEMVTAEA